MILKRRSLCDFSIYPYLSYEILAELIDSEVIKLGYKDVMINYRNAINKGLLKIMSKMGISTISSYRCSQLFEAIGIHDDVISLCFEGVDSRISGANFRGCSSNCLAKKFKNVYLQNVF